MQCSDLLATISLVLQAQGKLLREAHLQLLQQGVSRGPSTGSWLGEIWHEPPLLLPTNPGPAMNQSHSVLWLC